MSADAAQWFAVARILRPRGNKGEVAAELLTDFPERLSKVREVFLGTAHGKVTPDLQPQRYEVSSFWIHSLKKSKQTSQEPSHAIFHFAGVNSITAAEELRGRIVLLPITHRVKLPPGQYFVSDLVGCSVFEHPQPSGEPALASSPCSLAEAPEFLGKVSDVEFVGEEQQGAPLLHVDTAHGELLIPLAEEICFRISIPENRIDVRLPEGLRDLNEPE